MEAPWFYAHGGAPEGPVSRDDLKLAVLRGQVDRKSLVWREGMSQWLALEDVEELQPVLASLPPPLPNLEEIEGVQPVPAHLPPPLPPRSAVPQGPPAPPAQTTAPPQVSVKSREAPGERPDGGPPAERTEHESDRSRTRRRRRNRRSLVSWLEKARLEVLKSMLNRPVVSITVTTVIVGTTVVLAFQNGTTPPMPDAVTGQVLIDANPWGRIEWIEGPDGTRLDLPQGRTTPFSMTLPVGSYRAGVVHPHSKTSQRCDLQVRTDRVASCWLDLAPVDAQTYFQTIGW